MKGGNFVLILIIILAVIGFSLFILQNIPEKNPGEFTVGESRTVAENFIKNSPTYRFDGFDLRHVETITLRCPFCWEFVFEFQSRHAGYGDRTGKILLQVITEHKARIVVDHGKVVSAILDEKWDELNQGFLEFEILTSKELCEAGEGIWKEFPNSGEFCHDECGKPDKIICMKFMSMGCDCGENKCWNRTSCVSEKEFETMPIGECSTDSDCGTGGCSGQVCTTAEKAMGIITTCEFLPEYECLRLTSCGCIDGKCMWGENSAYRNCMDKLTR